MAIVWIPSLLRELSRGQEHVRVPGGTVGEVIDQLDAAFPGIRQKLCDVNGLRHGITVAVDTQISRLGLNHPVADETEVHFLPALGGGSGRARELLKQLR
jgi:molybdopterin synthase sulfur carrier subunit